MLDCSAIFTRETKRNFIRRGKDIIASSRCEIPIFPYIFPTHRRRNAFFSYNPKYYFEATISSPLPMNTSFAFFDRRFTPPMIANGQRKYGNARIRGKTGRDKKELVGEKEKRRRGGERCFDNGNDGGTNAPVSYVRSIGLFS